MLTRSCSTCSTTTRTIASDALIVPMTDSRRRTPSRAFDQLEAVPVAAVPATTGRRRGSWKQVSKAVRRGAGGGSPRRPPSPLGRRGDSSRPLRRGGDLGPDDDGDPRRPAERDDQLLQRGRDQRASSPTREWTPLFADPQYGIWPLINGTLLDHRDRAILVAIPLGIGSAIYLSEYATPRVRKIVKPILEVLVGVPTVVFGFFALTFVSPEVLNGFLGVDVTPANALAAGLVIGGDDPADDRLDLRGRDGGRAPGPARGGLRARCHPDAGGGPRCRAGRALGHRRRRSCSASRARSARR